MTSASGPFTGVRVLELTTGIAGRTAGMLLADLGADVARALLRPGGLPPTPGDVCWDRDKELVDLGDRLGAATELHRLASAADVVLSDARPGRLERLGLDSGSLLQRDASLVHVWLPPMGPRGRWSGLPHDSLLLAAVGGFAAHHPAVEDRPVAPVVPTISYLHGALGAAAAAAGLVGRRITGHGNAVTVSGLHALASVLGPLMVEALDADTVFSPGKSITGSPNYRMYRAADGRWLYLAALTPDFFFRALEVLDRMDVLIRPEVRGEFSNILIPAVGAVIGAELAARFAEQSCDHWLAEFARAGIPAAAVSTREEWMSSDIVAANGGRVELDDPRLGTVTLPGVPVSFSVSGGRVRHLPGPDHVHPRRSVWRDGHRSKERRAELPEHGRLPLAGLRVVDLCTFLAGPAASAILADHGADVVKVEPTGGDPYRVFSVSYLCVNQRKRAVALDLRTPGGRDALLRLVARSDVLVDNLRPASMERLDLGNPSFLAVNPALIRASVSAYGNEGPWADLPGFDPVMQALSGLVTAQGGTADPVPTSAPLHDACTGAVGALGILGAVLVRDRVGHQRVTTSLAAVSTYLQSAELTTFDGRSPNQTGGVDFPGPTATHRYYEARGGWLAVAADDRRLELLGVLGHPDWESLEDAELASRICAELAERDVELVVAELAAADVPAARVLDRHRELHDPFLVENRFSHVLHEPSLGRVRVVRSFAEWRGIDPAAPPDGSAIGAQTIEVLRESGVSLSESEGLVASGAASQARP